MKKVKLGTIAFLAILGIIVIVYSCKKDADLKKNYNYSRNNSEFIPDNNEVISLIKRFKAAHTAYEQGLKTYSDMPLEQALWTLEATVNYDFASERDSTTDFVYDTLVVYVESYYDEDTLILDGESLMEAYDDLYDFIFEQVTDSSNTRLIAGDLSITDTNSTTTTFTLVCITGPFVTGDYSINNTDYWNAANELGKCGNYSGQQTGKDASTRINQVLNWNHGYGYACANGGNLFYTSIDSVYIADDCLNGWCFWYGSSANECLDPDDMAYWVGVAEDVLEDNRPTGKVFIDVIYIDDYWSLSSTWVHRVCPVRYGIINCTEPGE